MRKLVGWLSATAQRILNGLSIPVATATVHQMRDAVEIGADSSQRQTPAILAETRQPS
jgi:hypothetical protein